MSVIEMKSLLEAGVHFGHQTRRWNPKMKRYIFIKRNGIHIIDLKQTLEAINQAYYFVRELAAKGKRVLFVGTKKQVSEGIQNAAEKCDEFYISHRWYGGTLTNLKTIRKSISKLDEFDKLNETGEINKFTKLEVLKMQRKYDKIQSALGGIRDMEEMPAALFIADIVYEKNAVSEAKNLNIPIIAIVDTNANPDGIDYVIPGNDDAMKSVNLICDIIANAVIEGKRIASEGGDISESETEAKDGKEEAVEIEEVEEVDVKKDSDTVTEIIEEIEVVEKVEKPKKEISKKEAKKPKKNKKEKKEPKEDRENKKEKRFECPECGKTFSSKRGLKIHLGLVHQK
ncbi:MAG TPA: 30S ribosomal protein S2 [Candidatus Cloacimonetes bacterium]|nr:30S ribosomal protein S2 [Candidatus Cloacimonadota bacterium]